MRYKFIQLVKAPRPDDDGPCLYGLTATGEVWWLNTDSCNEGDDGAYWKLLDVPEVKGDVNKTL